jgi:predicted Zn-dependent protease
MKFRALTLVAALFFSAFGTLAIAQESQTPTDNSKNTQVQGTTNQAPAPADTPSASAPVTPETPSDASAQSEQDKSDKDKKDKKKDEKDNEKNVKSGSKQDVESIGNRNIGGKGLGNWYSLEKEIAMGKQFAQEVESSVKLVQDPVVNEYVNRIGQNIVRNSDAKVPFTIKVVDSDEINAFALPGGFFYVNSGLILAADDEAELAGVMAHEIAHVAARHATRQMTRGQLANLASIPLIFMGGWTGYAIRSAAGFALPMTFLTFSRGFESEADFLGLQYMYKSGYDPQAFISFFEKIQAKEKKKPGTLAKAFSTHPLTPDRIEKSQSEIGKVLPAKETYVVNTSEFDSVKTRLAQIENKRKVTDDKDGKAPTLRRTAQTDDTKKSGDGKDDDRPTLKRRD